jgi:hypothetical protein
MIEREELAELLGGPIRQSARKRNGGVPGRTEPVKMLRSNVISKTQSVGRRLWMTSMAISLLVVSTLSALLWGMRIQPILYPLMRGAICSLAVTGGHGGSQAQEVIGAFVAFTVNWIIYSVGITFLAGIGHTFTGKGKNHRP